MSSPEAMFARAGHQSAPTPMSPITKHLVLLAEGRATNRSRVRALAAGWDGIERPPPPGYSPTTR